MCNSKINANVILSHCGIASKNQSLIQAQDNIKNNVDLTILFLTFKC